MACIRALLGMVWCFTRCVDAASMDDVDGNEYMDGISLSASACRPGFTPAVPQECQRRLPSLTSLPFVKPTRSPPSADLSSQSRQRQHFLTFTLSSSRNVIYPVPRLRRPPLVLSTLKHDTILQRPSLTLFSSQLSQLSTSIQVHGQDAHHRGKHPVLVPRAHARGSAERMSTLPPSPSNLLRIFPCARPQQRQ